MADETRSRRTGFHTHTHIRVWSNRQRLHPTLTYIYEVSCSSTVYKFSPCRHYFCMLIPLPLLCMYISMRMTEEKGLGQALLYRLREKYERDRLSWTRHNILATHISWLDKSSGESFSLSLSLSMLYYFSTLRETFRSSVCLCVQF